MTGAPSRLGVLINPTAGQGRARKIGAMAIEELRGLGHRVLDLTRTTPVGSYHHAKQRRGEYDALIVIGGDGMAHMGINLVATTSTPLGLIPAGSGNDLARHLGLPLRDLDAAISTILEALGDGPTPIDAMKLRPADGQTWAQDFIPTPDRWAGCVISAGFDSMVNQRANTYSWPRGMAKYIRGVLDELRTFSPYPYEITLEDRTMRLQGTLVAVANAPSFGGGMKIAPGANAVSGSLEVVIAEGISRGELLKVFPKVYRGTHTAHPAISLFATGEISIAAAPGGTIPPIYGDGELIGPAPVDIEIHSGAVAMLCPRLET